MIYRKEDFRLTKPFREPSMARCMMDGAGVFGDDIYAIQASFAVQQVYDRYAVWIRLTEREYRAFPRNRDALLPLLEDDSRLLLSRGSPGKDVTAFDADRLGPAPLGTASGMTR